MPFVPSATRPDVRALAAVGTLALALAVAPASAATTGRGPLSSAPTAALADTTPPWVILSSPYSGEVWTGGSAHAVTWIATDNVAVTAIDLYYRESDDDPWVPFARGLSNLGAWTWYVPSLPTSAARVRIVAWDAAGNQGEDMSHGVFTIQRPPGGLLATTLRDFREPGSQPLEGGTFLENTWCICHRYFDDALEPSHTFFGAMMSQATHDPLFRASLTIAEQDAPASGALCLRCHSPLGWLNGHTQPTNGSQLVFPDLDGVACDFCHHLVDPIYQPGVSPAVDEGILNDLLPAHRPTGYGNGQFVTDPVGGRRGPYYDANPPHLWMQSSFVQSADYCGTCHDLSNPLLARTGPDDYALGPLDQAADSISATALMPMERTYSEWKHSAYPDGVYAPQFAGVKPDGIVRVCQDCHLPDGVGPIADVEGVPVRYDVGVHDLTGGSVWLPPLIGTLYPFESDTAALADGAMRAAERLSKAAVLGIEVEPQPSGWRASVTVTNQAGHKLPTGFPEGRRMWLHVVARDGAGAVVYESGAYDAATGVLATEPVPVVYEAHYGLSPAFAGTVGLPGGSSYHFALNDTLYLDTRIPPLGFTNAAYAAFGDAPVDPSRPGPRYADGQNWDTSQFDLPASARSVSVTLLYQSTSKGYVDFLRDANTTDSRGQDMHDLWAANGRCSPVVMVSDSVAFDPVGVPAATASGAPRLRVLSNPFHDGLEMRLDLSAPAHVAFEVFDVTGRRLAHLDSGWLGGGAHRLTWDGRDPRGRDAGPGIFWVRVAAGGRSLTRKVQRLR